MSPTNHQRLSHLANSDITQFWDQQAQRLQWKKTWHTVLSGDFDHGNIRWFDGGELNVCVNCLDRHLPQHAQRTAFICEGNEINETQYISYQSLYEKVCQCANALRQLGVKKGDRVCIYLPNNLTAIITMLACARIGAVHSVVFAGFSAQALSERINDCEAGVLVTQGSFKRGTKTIELQAIAVEALKLSPSISHCIIHRPLSNSLPKIDHSDFDELCGAQLTDCSAAPMQAEDPLFILYTSGSTGKPKGMLHTTAGYLLYAAFTHQHVFGLDSHNDIYWCAADVGWITGHTYIVYGPLANGCTSVLFSGIPTYPTSSRYWDIIDEHKVSIFYTSPTAIRSLMRAGHEALQHTSRKSLRVLGSVGETINPDVWQWYHDKVGCGQAHVVDTWWQTETGGIMIAALPQIHQPKPGAAQKALYGIKVELIDDQQNILPHSSQKSGRLVITQPWPAIARSIYKDHNRYLETYFPIPNMYLSGDSAYRDEDSDLFISGRIDDVMNVSGHRLGSAEIENAAMTCNYISECAAVALPDPIKGEGIYLFAVSAPEYQQINDIPMQIKQAVRSGIGAIATPNDVYLLPALPKTRSGKIMRRLIRKVMIGDNQLGDLSTLSNPEAITALRALIKNINNSSNR